MVLSFTSDPKKRASNEDHQNDAGQEQTSHKPPFVYWVCLWGIGLSFALVAVATDLTMRAPHIPPGRDFANLYTAGTLALQGDAWKSFDVNWFRLELFSLLGALTLQNYSYPPHALLLAVPFAMLPYPVAFITFTLVGAALFFYAARSFTPFPRILCNLTPAAALNIWNGHYGLLLGGLWLLFFTNLESRPWRAGLAAAAMTFKPHMGLFVAVASLTRRRTFMVAVAGTLGLVLLSGFAFGFDSWEAFFTSTAAQQQSILTSRGGEFYFRMMPSSYVAYGGGAIGILFQLCFALCALIMLVRRPTLNPFALATATFLVIPYVFNYDMTVACLGFASLLFRLWYRLTWVERIGLSLAFLVPNICFIARPIVPPILLYGLWLQLRYDQDFSLAAATSESRRSTEIDPVRAG